MKENEMPNEHVKLSLFSRLTEFFIMGEIADFYHYVYFA